MHVRRIRARVPDAQPVEVALLHGHILRFHKRGRDGSGKCTVVPDRGNVVAGVVYVLNSGSLPRLDRAEGRGYRRNPVVVSGIRSGRRYRAHCYAAKACAVDDRCVAYEWYRDIVVAGAEAHALPLAYVGGLRAVPACADPNPRRQRQQAAVLSRRGRSGHHVPERLALPSRVQRS